MLDRLERKLAEAQQWVDSVFSLCDWPAAIALAIFRTRPAEGTGMFARVWRRVVPYLWVRPATLHGLSVRMDPSEIDQLIIFEEVFIDGVYDLDQLSFAPDLILDCGAFEGYFSLLAAVRFPAAPIIAFEPNPRNLEGLQANLSRKGLSIEVRAEAVSTSDGTAPFSGGGCGGRLGGTEGSQVTVVDLRRVIATLNPQRLLLKLDVEGEELTLLPALLPMLPRCCAMFFEWHHDRGSFDRAVASLRGNGFETGVIRDNRADQFTTYIDAFAQRC